MVNAKLIHKKCDKARAKDIELSQEDIDRLNGKKSSELDSFDFASMRWLFNKQYKAR